MEKYVVAILTAIICGRHQGPIDYEARVTDAVRILKTVEKVLGAEEAQQHGTV